VSRAAGVAVAGIVLTLAAFTFDAAPLFVPGAAFTLLGVITPMWVWASARGADVRRRLVADRVIEGEPVEAMIEVRRGRLGLPGGEVLDSLAGAPVSLSRPLSLVAGGSRAEVRIVARMHRRGMHRMEPPSLVVHDTLELARIVRAGSGPPQELLILPRTEPVRWPGGGRGERLESGGSPAVGEPMAAVDVDGLRPYRPGTPASRIHWAALARGAGLLERRLQPDGDTRPLIVLDARGSGPIEHLDAAVRAAASLSLEFARRGGCRLLLPGERRTVTIEPDLSNWPGVHARLALVQGGPGARPPILGPAARLGALFYVTPQASERLPAALNAAGSDASALVIPASVASRTAGAPSFTVSGCHGYVLGARPARSARSARSGSYAA
jgi:uncharacterized protein (DUF58 family)